MKIYSTNNFYFGSVSVGAAVVVYLFAVYQYYLAPLIILVALLLIMSPLLRIKYQINSHNLIKLKGGKEVYKADLKDCKLYKRGNHFFGLVTCDNSIIWGISFLDKRSEFLNEIFGNESENLSKAEANSILFFKKIGYASGCLVGCFLLLTPLVQTMQLPKLADEMVEIEGTISSITLNKALLIEIKESSKIFVFSPKAGDLDKYSMRLEGLVNNSVIFQVSKLDILKEHIPIWGIKKQNVEVISQEQIFESWKNWKRWGVISSFGVILLIYCFRNYRRVEFSI